MDAQKRSKNVLENSLGSTQETPNDTCTLTPVIFDFLNVAQTMYLTLYSVPCICTCLILMT